MSLFLLFQSDDRPCDEADDDDGVNGEAPYLDGAVEEDVNFADGNLIQAPEMVGEENIRSKSWCYFNFK